MGKILLNLLSNAQKLVLDISWCFPKLVLDFFSVLLTTLCWIVWDSGSVVGTVVSVHVQVLGDVAECDGHGVVSGIGPPGQTLDHNIHVYSQGQCTNIHHCLCQ